ncbi:MAG: filamentous hemagglutinin N-terminal domain-containing protein [Nitrospirota bacterium]|nr:filamentous hemagglutinin N-terminal domain-containing protein [Nitrospirota bacterium]
MTTNTKKSKKLRIFSWKEKVVAMVLSATVPLATMPSIAFALPHGGQVTKGHATLSYSTNTLLIRQSTSQASFSWTGFNVGSAQSVTYRTPGASSVSMNFIGGTGPANISGKVTSNGILYFMDANGIVFGSGSTVSAAGIRAYGSATPGCLPTGAVTNAGTLTAGAGGQVVLVGTSVTNTGTILAPSGQVILAAGSTVTVSQTPSSSLSVASTGGGTVLDSGVIKAENLDGTPGEITLEAGMGSGTTTLTQSAILDASAPAGGNGGAITVDGSRVVLDEVAPLDVSAPNGTPGTITIDPTVTEVGTASALEAIDSSQSAYLNNSSVCIVLMANINLGGTSWTPLGNGSSSSNYFTGTFDGQGHTVSGYTITASNSNGTGFIGYLGSGGTVENLGVEGTVNGGTYHNIGGVVGTNYGTVKGSWNTGSVSGDCYVGGVVGENSGAVKNSYNTGNVSGGSNVGGVVGYNNGGTVETSYNTGSVGVGNFVGGVVGSNNSKVEYSYNNGSVCGFFEVGGVAGTNSGTVETSYNTGSVVGGNYVGGVAGTNGGTVETSYNTGSVSGGSIGGGVAGYNNGGTVETSYYLSGSSSVAVGAGSCTSCSSFMNSASNSSTTFNNLGSFTGWNAATGTFSTPSATWYIGPGVTVGSGITAPVLVSDLPVDTVEGIGNSVYNGTIEAVVTASSQSLTMGGSALTSGITVTAGPNVGTYTVTPSVSLSAPTTQTSVGSVSVLSGTWTITKAPLNFSSVGLSNPTMTYDGSTSIALTRSNSSATLSGFVSGQGATYTGATGTFSSPSAGTHTVTATLSSADFSGSGTGFSWSNYSLPTLALSGTGTIVPANVSPSGSGSSGTGGGSEGVFSNLAVPPPIENIVENMNQNSSPTPIAASSVFGGNVTSSRGNGGTGDGILDVSDLPR